MSRWRSDKFLLMLTVASKMSHWEAEGSYHHRLCTESALLVLNRTSWNNDIALLVTIDVWNYGQCGGRVGVVDSKDLQFKTTFFFFIACLLVRVWSHIGIPGTTPVWNCRELCLIILLTIHCQLRARRALTLLKMFCWEPEGGYGCTKSIMTVPFWLSMEHHWTALTPFWF